MAQFYAEVQGNRGPASRMGSKDSGMWGHIRGWHVGCKVRCYYDEALKGDVIEVYRTGGSSGSSQHEHLIARLFEGERGQFQKALHGQFGIELAETKG